MRDEENLPQPMSQADFCAWLALMGRKGRPMSVREAANRLGYCRNTVKSYKNGETRIPPNVGLACSAVALGLPSWSQRLV